MLGLALEESSNSRTTPFNVNINYLEKVDKPEGGSGNVDKVIL